MVIDEAEFEGTVVVGDCGYISEYLFKTLIEKPLIGILLDLDQVLLEVCREGRDLAAVPFPRCC